MTELRSIQTASLSATQAEIDSRCAQTLKQLGQVEISASPLLKLIRTNPSDADTLIEVLRLCPTLTVKLLSVINSAAFALPRQIDCVRRAVLQLGASRTHAISLAFALRVLNEATGLPKQTAHHLWVNSLRKAVAAKLACEATNCDETEQAHCHALVQDIGLAMLMKVDQAFYEQHLQLTQCSATWCEQETERFGINHAQIGNRLLHEWDMPNAVC
jgi:HD-like signal output (HDOD) protein